MAGRGPFAGVRLIRVDPGTPTSEQPGSVPARGNRRVPRPVPSDLHGGARGVGPRIRAPGRGRQERAAWAHGRGSWLRWHARDRRSTGCSGWSESFPTTQAGRRSADSGVEAGGGGPGDAAAARASYAALVDAESQSTSLRHEVLLAVTVHAGRTCPGRQGGAGGAETGACTVLLREVAALRRRLADASIDVGAVLSPAALAAVVRDAYDARGAPDSPRARTVTGPGSGDRTSPRSRRPVEPVSRTSRGRGPWGWRRNGADCEPTARGTPPTGWRSGPGPTSAPTSSGRSCCRRDIRRTMSVVMEPLGPIEASRKVRAGPHGRHRRRRAAPPRWLSGHGETTTGGGDPRARREVELADGHAQYRFSGYVTVSAADPTRSRRRAVVSSRPPDRPGSSCVGATGTRPTPSCARCRSAAAWPEAGSCRGASPPTRPRRAISARVYPFVSEPGLVIDGAARWSRTVACLVGRDLLGGDVRLRPVRALPPWVRSPTPTWS